MIYFHKILTKPRENSYESNSPSRKPCARIEHCLPRRFTAQHAPRFIEYFELGITCWIAARIDEEGSTTVPARTFSDLVNTLPGDQVQLALDVKTQNLHIKGGSSNNDVKCIDAQEFPPLPTPEMEGAVPLNVVDFKEMIHQVAFAASTDEARPVLMGVQC